MSERGSVPHPIERMSKVERLAQDRDPLMEEKKEHLTRVKEGVLELFGQETLPKELLREAVGIRREIAKAVQDELYVDALAPEVETQIDKLMAHIAWYHRRNDAIERIEQDGEQRRAVFASGETEIVGEAQEDLRKSLRAYFESYRHTLNATQFRQSVDEIANRMLEESKTRRRPMYSQEEKDDLLLDRMSERYLAVGFTKKEIKELVKLADFESLDALEIHEIKTLSKIKEVFARFLGGDTSKYVALSVALTLPAFLNGLAPSFLADAFVGEKIDIQQVGMYSLLMAASTGLSFGLHHRFKEFFITNFGRKGGIDEYVSSGITALPPEDIGRVGATVVQNRTQVARESYQDMMEMIGFDIVPASVTLATSIAMLYEKSPALAAATAGGTGLMIVIDRYVNKWGKFWKKEGEAKETQERTVERLQELLRAHMEIVLSGEKDKFLEEMQGLLHQDQVAAGEKNFFRKAAQSIGEFYGALNMVVAGLAASLAGGSPDKFIAALAYSGQFNHGVNQLLSSKRRLASDLRNLMHMDLVFNGYAAEEAEKEKTRKGVSEVSSYSISLRGVELELSKRKILSKIDLVIPQGSFVSLQGLSGSGKSTLLKVLSGYYRPSAGDVRVGDTPMDEIKRSGPDSLFQRTAYLSQFPHIIQGTVRENLLFG
ncbi:MAG: ATP-binding cassette domain-containing protein, partial [Candidatus Uhrbacteria bacterium]|nr:ATP-binding cassette domain-containing protein [Candidatus Uhrbacteria bacterium]